MAPSWYSWILFSNLLTPSILLKPLLISSTGTQNLGIWNMLSSSWKTNTTTPSCFLCKKELWKLVGYLSEHFESSRIIKNPLTLLRQYCVSAKPVKGSFYHFKYMCDSNQITLMLFWQIPNIIILWTFQIFFILFWLLLWTHQYFTNQL